MVVSDHRYRGVVRFGGSCQWGLPVAQAGREHPGRVAGGGQPVAGALSGRAGRSKHIGTNPREPAGI